MICGGHSEALEPTPEIVEMVDNFKTDIEAKANMAFSQYTVVSYTSQVVAGTNFIIKVDVSTHELEVKVFRPLPHTNEPPRLIDVILTEKN